MKAMTTFMAILCMMKLTMWMKVEGMGWLGAEWKYAMQQRRLGGQSVMTPGLTWMLLWLASKQGCLNMVS